MYFIPLIFDTNTPTNESKGGTVVPTIKSYSLFFKVNNLIEMKKILITGGAGYIGSHTAVELWNAGLEPIILDDFSNSLRI